ncbi:MAG: hypothetical protein AAF907_05750, partial [Planctomycetota bacterium]
MNEPAATVEPPESLPDDDDETRLELAKAASDDVQIDQFAILDSEQIVKTISRIESRIADRFPDAGLRRVCRKLYAVSLTAGERSESFGRPNLWFRALIWLLILGVAFTLVATVVMWAKPTTEELGF